MQELWIGIGYELFEGISYYSALKKLFELRFGSFQSKGHKSRTNVLSNTKHLDLFCKFLTKRRNFGKKKKQETG